MLLPAEARPLLAAFAPHSTAPTHARFVVPAAAAGLTTGRRTVAHLPRTVGASAAGHAASYRRVLSAAEWSGPELGCALTRLLLAHVVPGGPVDLVGDDPVGGHPGPTASGTGRRRDAVRSSHTVTAWRYGHKGVVPAVLVKFPFATRRWARPVLVDRSRTPVVSQAGTVRHRTPAQLTCRRLGLVPARLPARTFVFAGDAGSGAHEVARFVSWHRGQLTRVRKCHPDTNRCDPPPPYAGPGRPRVEGGRVPKPRPAAATAARTKRTVPWYGGRVTASHSSEILAELAEGSSHRERPAVASSGRSPSRGLA